MSTVLVTGAGSGMGNATARLLAAAGHTVYAVTERGRAMVRAPHVEPPYLQRRTPRPRQ